MMLPDNGMQEFTGAFRRLTESKGSSLGNCFYIWHEIANNLKLMDGQPRNDNTRLVVALALIGIGAIWLLQKAGTAFNITFPLFTPHLFNFRPMFMSFGKLIFSWQMILIIVGIILVIGKRPAGYVLIIIGAVFILPRLMIFPHLSFSFLIPLVLVIAGLVLIFRSKSK